MDIETCIQTYLAIAPEIFAVECVISRSRLGQLANVLRGEQRFDPDPLENAIKRLVKEH